MKTAFKIIISLGALAVLSLIGIMLAGDIYVLPHVPQLIINEAYYENAYIGGGRIMLDISEFAAALGSDVKYNMAEDKLTVKYYGNTIMLSAGERELNVNGAKSRMRRAPIRGEGDCFYVPVRDVALSLGCDVSWDSQREIAYISPPHRVNTLDGTEPADEYRYYKYNGTFSGFDIFGNGKEYICTENVNISREHCDRYAALINSFAKAVPDAQTYSVLVPTSAEFYSSEDKKSNYTDSFRYIYSELDDGVYGVNTVSPLSEHADEDIYFNTDHHWTQLGAYYAYREFLNFGFDSIAPISSFKKQTVEYYQGSFLNYTEGTEGYKYMADSYDRLDMYYPMFSSSGEAYYDSGLKEYIGPVKVIDTSFKNYDCFMDGDCPVEVYKTSNRNNRRLCIVKDSFGNAFGVWALNNYEEVYVIDYRRFNNYSGDSESYREFRISDFYKTAPFDDLVILSYPVTVSSDAELSALEKLSR